MHREMDLCDSFQIGLSLSERLLKKSTMSHDAPTLTPPPSTPDEGAFKMLEFELSLMRSDFDGACAGLGLAGDSDLDEIKHSVEADGGEEVFRWPQRGEA